MLKKCFYLIGSSFFYVLPPFIFNKSKSLRCWIYSGYQSEQFCKCGLDFYLREHSTIVGGKHINIGDYVSIGKRAVLTAWNTIEYEPRILIGDNTIIGDDCHITAINKILIGKNVLLGKKITISDNSHGKTTVDELRLPPIRRQLYSKGPVIIKDGVWIGDKATILAGVTIGENSIVGANAVVTKDYPANSVIGGIPSRILKIMS